MFGNKTLRHNYVFFFVINHIQSVNSHCKCQAGKSKDSVRREREGKRGLKESNGGKRERELQYHFSTCACVCVYMRFVEEEVGGRMFLPYSTEHEEVSSL